MPLKTHIKNLITHSGPISIARFMQEALAHPDYGYYKTKEPFGVAGDFTTAPEISQMFGELIGIWCADIWQQMGSPHDIEIVEIGPGRGTLMDDLLRATKRVQGFHDSISISMIETSKRLVEVQQTKIGHKHPRIKWLQDISELPQKPLILVANELFDALPVHQYVKHDGKWCEVMVGLSGAGELEFVLVPSSSREEAANIPNGAIVEISPMAITLMEKICGRIKEHGGAALIIDYGYIEPEYKDTVSAISNHKHSNILEDIGSSDISAHVDFGILANLAKSKAVMVYGAVNQGSFLGNMGIEIRMQKLSEGATDEQKQALQIARDRLISDEQMGELFKVLAVCNGVAPVGF